AVVDVPLDPTALGLLGVDQARGQARGAQGKTLWGARTRMWSLVCGYPPRLCGPLVLVDQAVEYLSALQADLIEIDGCSRGMWWLRWLTVS
ncbi:hypothetical protein, partial [Nonomuraea sp. NPDC046570]|uniref:hypothetical protein n=1 Tax=Nonomuraea sp. NPDC046570 TaxID=3155255 RepID=UPI0033D16782